MVKGNQEILC